MLEFPAGEATRLGESPLPLEDIIINKVQIIQSSSSWSGWVLIEFSRQLRWFSLARISTFRF